MRTFRHYIYKNKQFKIGLLTCSCYKYVLQLLHTNRNKYIAVDSKNREGALVNIAPIFCNLYAFKSSIIATSNAPTFTRSHLELTNYAGLVAS